MTISDKIKKLRSEIQWQLDSLNESDALYIPKCVYIPKGKLERYVTFWPSELMQGKDIYISMSSRDYESEDPDNTLYKWNFNPEYITYEKGTPSSTGDFPYIVKFKELSKVVITPPRKGNNIPSQDAIDSMLEEDCENTTSTVSYSEKNVLDWNIKDVTLRDLMAAIHLIPISKNQFVNDQIILIKSLNNKQ
jgi:hypothetical protein